jgi:hypothetical protein
MAKKRTNLQPWLDYFKMLQQYEQKGFLEIKPQEHEAYITRAALLTLSNINPEDIQSATILSQPPTIIADTLFRLRAYAAYRWAPAVGQQHPVDINDPDAEIPVIPIEELTAYFSQPFAIHIVKEDYPHDLLLTLLLQQKRSWYGRRKETIEVIDYTEQKPQEK